MLADWKIAAATCAETVDLASYGIGHNRCIDGELLLRISENDRELLRAFNVDCTSAANPLGHQDPLGQQNPLGWRNPLGRQLNCRPNLPAIFDQNILKDKGQRKACGCIASKDIGQYDTCPHLCRYCYANASPQMVLGNMGRFSADGESIMADPSGSPT